MTDADYIDDLVILANTHAQAKSLLHSLEQAVEGIALFMILDKTGFMCFKQDSAISRLNGKPMKLVNHFTYLVSNISSTEGNINIDIGKVWTAVDRLWSI